MKTENRKSINKIAFILKITAAILCVALTGALCAAYMVYTGRLIPNKMFITDNDVIGCDVSRYQGDIQWDLLARQNISFAFIKATEGSSYVDPAFPENWEQAFQTRLYVGAYHFFSFESPGEGQAQHFVETVPIRKQMLSPVVDIEFYGSYNEQNTDAPAIRAELSACLLAMEAAYGSKPIIYTTPEAYDHFIKGHYEDYPLWIRSVLTRPHLDRDWQFWQYTNRERLDGYSGPEQYIDMNVFHGTEAMLCELLLE